MVVAAHAHVVWDQQETLDATARGQSGFGSTGTNS
jgi:dUTPase